MKTQKNTAHTESSTKITKHEVVIAICLLLSFCICCVWWCQRTLFEFFIFVYSFFLK